MKRIYFTLLLLFAAGAAAAQEYDPEEEHESVFMIDIEEGDEAYIEPPVVYVEEEHLNIPDHSEQFFSNGALMKKVARDNKVVMMGLEPTNDYGKLYKLYISVYNNTDHPITVLDSDIQIKTNKGRRGGEVEMIKYKKYNKRVKSRGLTYEFFVGDLDNLVFGKNPNVQRTTSTRKRDNRGGGDDTLFMTRYRTFRNDHAEMTRVTYNSANRYIMREVANDSDFARGLKGIMSKEYFRSNTIDMQNRFISGYMAFKRKKSERIEVSIDVDGTPFLFVWDERELGQL